MKRRYIQMKLVVEMIKNHKQKQLKSILRKKLKANIKQVLDIQIDVPIELVDFEENLKPTPNKYLKTFKLIYLLNM
jgi:hypothetical protein